MTERTFTFNVEQLKAIFDAGRSRGSEEEASYQCGSRCTGAQYDGLVDSVYHIVNEGVSVLQEEHIDIFEVEKWFK